MNERDGAFNIPDYLQRKELPEGPPENFRGNEFGYFPERIVELTKRVITLNYLIDSSLSQRDSDLEKVKFRKKLFDLVVYNAFGRVFPNPDSAGDFVGVVDPKKTKDSAVLRNCIILTKIRTEDGDKLAIAGGFAQAGEAMTQAVARKASSEIGASNVADYVFFDEESKPNRDPRKVVVSTCIAGLVDSTKLKDNVFFFPLFDPQTGRLNDDYFKPGTYTDAKGQTITHQGLRADHDIIITKLYKFWLDHSEIGIDGQSSRLSLDETLQKISPATPQEWFKHFQDYPSSEGKITAETDNGKTEQIKMTPNIQFAIEKAEQIFKEYRFSDARKRAENFVLQCVKDDILPEYPQSAVTIDCVLVKSDTTGDKLVVQQKADGTLALPGSFYSPEFEDARRQGQSVDQIAQVLVASKLGVDFRPSYYLGTVGGTVALGHQADQRYPRLSHIYAGIITGAYKPSPGSGLEEGSNIVEIPIWQDKKKGILSTAIQEGIDKKGWSYDHNREIIIPLLISLLKTLYPSGKLTAEQIIRQQIH